MKIGGEQARFGPRIASLFVAQEVVGVCQPVSLRLLWLVPYFPWPADSGGKIRAWEVLSRLASRGVEIDVWYPLTRGAEYPSAPQIDGLNWHGHPSLLGAGRWRKAASIPGKLPVAVRAVYDKATKRNLASIASGYDAVVLEQSYHAPWIDRGCEVPLVMTAQNVEYQLIAQMSRQAPKLETRLVYWVDARKFRRLETDLFRKSDLVIAVSVDDQELIRRDVPSARVSVRPNGVDLETYAYREPVSGPARRLLMTGMLGYPPNFDAALWIHREILPRVRESVPDARIDLVGARCPPELHSLHDPETGYNVVGYVDDIMPSLRAADVFLMPLRMGGGTRLKALQAMACGLPVVSTAHGVEGIGVTPGSDVSVGETSDELAAHCVRLLEDGGRRREQAARARTLVENGYGWESIVDGIHADLSKLVTRQSSAGTRCE